MSGTVHNCTQCSHSLRDPSPTPEQQIAGRVDHLCLRMPPCVMGVMTQQGLAAITAYPRVNAQTMTCGEYLSRAIVGG